MIIEEDHNVALEINSVVLHPADIAEEETRNYEGRDEDVFGQSRYTFPMRWLLIGISLWLWLGWEIYDIWDKWICQSDEDERERHRT